MMDEIEMDYSNINWSDNIIFQFNGNYSFLSTFFPSIIILNLYVNNEYKPIKFKDIETAYEYGKAYFAHDCINMKNILNTMSPRDAQIIGNNNIKFLNENDLINWENNKFQWMYNINYEKFNQNIDLQIKLVETYPKILINGNIWNDKYWGYSLQDQTGSNNLGIILMLIRDRFIHHQNLNLFPL